MSTNNRSLKRPPTKPANNGVTEKSHILKNPKAQQVTIPLVQSVNYATALNHTMRYVFTPFDIFE